MKRKFKISLATKFAATFAALLLVIMLLVTLAVRRVLITQFTSQYRNEVKTTLESMQNGLSARHAAIADQLQQLAAQLSEDYKFRLYTVLLNEPQQSYVLDYAQNYMARTGLQALEITEEEGRVLSSGHNRDAFASREEALVHGLQAVGQQQVDEPKPPLAWFQRPEGKFICLAAIDSVQLGAKKFFLAGGVEITTPFLREFHPDTAEIFIMQFENSVLSSSPQWSGQIHSKSSSTTAEMTEWWAGVEEEYAMGDFTLPIVAGNSSAPAVVSLLHPKTELTKLLHGLQQRIFIIMGLGIVIAVAISIWRARAITKPLQRLAAAAGELSLDRPQADFNVKSRDEVGILSAAMQDMMQRLRENYLELTKAEQKAALAEIARQVNHDIKNGLIPIRNVMQHWMDVAKREPGKLIEVFNERKMTVLESVNYLENLARGSSRLQPRRAVSAVNVNQIIHDLLKSYQNLPRRRIRFLLRLHPSALCVRGDAVQLRRAFENVLQNALEAIKDDGMISVSTESSDNQVLVTWNDNGAGIPDNVRRQLFQAHVTTKPEGTGLGLVNVKHIVDDFGGQVTIESEPGRGTTVRFALLQMNGDKHN